MKNIESLLGELLLFVSDVATSIRMNSAYNRLSAGDPEPSQSVLWLSDVLHNLHVVGKALQGGDYSEIAEAASFQRQYWEDAKEPIKQASLQNIQGEPCFDIEKGIEILRKIEAAAKKLADTVLVKEHQQSGTVYQIRIDGKPVRYFTMIGQTEINDWLKICCDNPDCYVDIAIIRTEILLNQYNYALLEKHFESVKC